MLKKIIRMVDNWMDRQADRDHERYRKANPRTTKAAGADYDHTAKFHRFTTIGTWVRNGRESAACINCRNRHGLALSWLEGNEEGALFSCCECATNWCDPMWANKEATEYVLNTSEITWAESSVWFPDPDPLTEEMRRESAAEKKRRKEME